MIGFLRGTPIGIKPTSVLLDVHGVGYNIYISVNTYESIAQTKDISLFIHTAVKEDSITLYGFLSEADKDFFELLISVSGVGPKTALGILSGAPIPEIKHALQTGDIPRLTRLPGIGKKSAERLVLELRSKIGSLDTTAAFLVQGDIRSEAVLALISLGYQSKIAEKTIREAADEHPEALLEELIRLSLRKLA